MPLRHAGVGLGDERAPGAIPRIAARRSEAPTPQLAPKATGAGRKPEQVAERGGRKAHHRAAGGVEAGGDRVGIRTWRRRAPPRASLPAPIWLDGVPAQWPYLYSQSRPTPALDPPLEVDARLEPDMAGDIEIQVHSIVLRPRSGRDADAHPVVDRAGCADQSAAGGARADVQAVDAERFSHILERVGLARQSRDRVRQLKRLERRQAARRLLKQDARKDFIFRQARIGADLKSRLKRRASHGDLGGDAARARLGDEIEIGHDVAMEADISAGEGQARAQEHERAAQKLEAPGDLRVAGGAVHMQVSAQFGVDAATADENAVHRGDRNGERRIERRRARAGSFRLGRQRKPRPRGRGRVQMFRAGKGSRDAGEATGHGNIHADNRDASVDSWASAQEDPRCRAPCRRSRRECRWRRAGRVGRSGEWSRESPRPDQAALRRWR